MIYPFDMRVVFTEDGVMIDGEPLTEHPNLRFYGDTEHDGKANLRSGNLKPNEDNTMKYRVATDHLRYWNEGTQIGKDARDELVNNQGVPESWFEPVEQVQEGQYWEVEYKTTHNRIKRITKVEDDIVNHKEIRSGYEDFCGVDSLVNNARKLSTDEIKEALTEEAKRRGLVKGTTVKRNFYIETDNKVELDGEREYKYRYDSSTDILYHSGWAIYKEGQWAEVLDQTPTIEINGYEAEFHEDYVKFGCAKIHKKHILDIHQNIKKYVDVETYHHCEVGDVKVLTGVKIGQGLFSRDQIKQIAEYYQTNKDDE